MINIWKNTFNFRLLFTSTLDRRRCSHGPDGGALAIGIGALGCMFCGAYDVEYMETYSFNFRVRFISFRLNPIDPKLKSHPKP